MKNFLTLFLFIGLTTQISIAQEFMYVTAGKLNMRSSPEVSDNVIKSLQYGDAVEVMQHSDDWAKVKHQYLEGFVSTKYLSSTRPDISLDTPKENYVLICNSNTAYAYHSHRCSGLSKCTHSISEIQKSEANSLGRSPCKICFKGSSSSKGYSSPTPSYKAPSGGGCPSVQCSGITQKGARCRNRTTNCGGRCYHHD